MISSAGRCFEVPEGGGRTFRMGEAGITEMITVKPYVVKIIVDLPAAAAIDNHCFRTNTTSNNSINHYFFPTA